MADFSENSLVFFGIFPLIFSEIPFGKFITISCQQKFSKIF